jgi:hypothetical protein
MDLSEGRFEFYYYRGDIGRNHARSVEWQISPLSMVIILYFHVAQHAVESNALKHAVQGLTFDTRDLDSSSTVLS